METKNVQQLKQKDKFTLGHVFLNMLKHSLLLTYKCNITQMPLTSKNTTSILFSAYIRGHETSHDKVMV